MNPKKQSIDEVLGLIESNQRIVTAMAPAEPRQFFSHLHNAVKNKENILIHCANPSENYPCFSQHELKNYVTFEVMFLTHNVIHRQDHKHVHYVPQHLSQWSKNILARGPVDIFWGTCSYPNEQGFVSLGLNCCYEPEILAQAKYVILEMNKNVPYTYGKTEIHSSRIHSLIESSYQLPSIECKQPSTEDYTIAQYVCEFIQNESTLQFGIGAIPDSIGSVLKAKQNLGIHTELMTESMMELMKQGIVTNSKKSIHPGKTVCSFIYGSQELYKFSGKNEDIILLPSSYVNDPFIIGQNKKMVSVNTAIEIDLTGQVCSESVGHCEISGVGGATDTHTGAQRSSGGRGIIALRSAASDLSYSKIVFELRPGAKVSISRNDIDTVITEFGVAELKGMSVATRARRMIQIAHPKFRDNLYFQAQKEGYI